MAGIKEMAEAHLRNVDQQIRDLEQQKEIIDQDIEKLKQYLSAGVSEMQSLNQTSLDPSQSVNPSTLQLPEEHRNDLTPEGKPFFN